MKRVVNVGGFLAVLFGAIYSALALRSWLAEEGKKLLDVVAEGDRLLAGDLSLFVQLASALPVVTLITVLLLAEMIWRKQQHQHKPDEISLTNIVH